MTDEERVALAVAALAEVTDPADVGPLVDVVVPQPGVVDLRFATAMSGYPGWLWTVSTSALEGVEPTVLELELVPGDGALLAPPWVPWTDRLAEWRRSHAEGAAGAADHEESGDTDDLDEDDADDVDEGEPDDVDEDDDLDDDEDVDDAGDDDDLDEDDHLGDDEDDDDEDVEDDDLDGDADDVDLDDDEDDGLDDGVDVEAAGGAER